MFTGRMFWKEPGQTKQESFLHKWIGILLLVIAVILPDPKEKPIKLSTDDDDDVTTVWDEMIPLFVGTTIPLFLLILSAIVYAISKVT